MSPIAPTSRSESHPLRLLGAFAASLGVHVALALAVWLAWPTSAPPAAPRPRVLVVDLVAPTSPLLDDGPAVPRTEVAHAAPVANAGARRGPAGPATVVRTVADGESIAAVSTAVSTDRVREGVKEGRSPTSRTALPALPAQPESPAAPGIGQGGGDASGGNPDEVVRAWLAMHQHYPRAARRHRIEGTVTLAFALNAQGRVVRAEIDGTSGSRVLDRAALDLLGRAEPFPVAATDVAAELPFEIEVEYRLASMGNR